MINKRKKYMLIISLMLLFIYIVPCLFRENWNHFFCVGNADKVMGILMLDDMEILNGKKKISIKQNPGICFEGTLLPYDRASNTLYLSQRNVIKEWEGQISTDLENAFICTTESGWDNKNETINNGTLLPIWLVVKDEYYEFNLVISGMPILCIDTKCSYEPEKPLYEEEPDKYVFDSETRYCGEFVLYNPGVGVNKYEIVSCNLEYHIKGASSLTFDKKGYALNLKNYKNENLDVSLLGMREDNSWKLNALVTDENRIREKTASQIWEEFSKAEMDVNESGPRMEYVEVIIDNNYKGLYCLVEPIDEKKLNLQNEDILYKIVDWNIPEDEDFNVSIQNKWNIVYPIRVRYPKQVADYEKVWYPIKNYIDTIYGWKDMVNVENKLHLGNSADIMMYLMTVTAWDNNYRNMYYVADVNADGAYRIIRVPWDLDYTFGNYYVEEAKHEGGFNADIEAVYQEAVPYVLMHCVPNEFTEVLHRRWLNYRQSFLSTDAIIKILTDNRNYLDETGAIKREAERWPEYSVSSDIEYLLIYQKERMEWLDEYFMQTADEYLLNYEEGRMEWAQ